MKRLFIISDLHLGGRPDAPGEPGAIMPGFQICRAYHELVRFIDWVRASGKRTESEELELVINGDIVDFLAEDDFTESLRGAQIWTVKDEDAVAKLNRISERARDADGRGVFDALKDFLVAGHSLTLLLGNHDVELSLPAVRRRLTTMLGGASRLQFVFDGEAYTVGRVLIEHGNRYDRWNMIGYSGLRQERSVRSRQLPVDEGEREQRYFVPPAGTYIVIHFMNRIKSLYRFIDLLKPEGSAVIPLLLALEPDRRKHLKEILNASPVIRNYIRHGLRTPVIPKQSGDLTALRQTEREVTLGEILEATLGADARYFGDVDAVSRAGDLSAQRDEEMSDIIVRGPSSPNTEGDLGLHGHLRGLKRGLKKTAFGVVDWFLSRSTQYAERARSAAHYLSLFADAREPGSELLQLYAALKHLNYCDSSFELGSESANYLEAAKESAARGDFDVVVYGHTHLPKKISLPVSVDRLGARGAGHPRWYLNTGTWCDVMRLPEALTGTYEEAEPELRRFVNSLRRNNLSEYTRRYLSFVELLVDPSGGRPVDEPQLFSYCGAGRERSAPLTDILTRRDLTHEEAER